MDQPKVHGIIFFYTRLQYVRTHPREIYFKTPNAPFATRSFLSEATAIFVNNLQMICGPRCERNNSSMTVDIRVDSDNVDLNWDTPEEYSIFVFTKGLLLL